MVSNFPFPDSSSVLLTYTSGLCVVSTAATTTCAEYFSPWLIVREFGMT